MNLFERRRLKSGLGDIGFYKKTVASITHRVRIKHLTLIPDNDNFFLLFYNNNYTHLLTVRMGIGRVFEI